MAYSPSFLDAVKRTLDEEGVFSYHPSDRGGATKYGITEKVARRHGFDVRKLTIPQATEIYHQDYWLAFELDSLLSPRIAGEIFDTGVNMGPARAAEIAQQAAWFFGFDPGKIDGDIGPKTVRAINALTPKYEEQFLYALNGFQFNRYYDIADDNPTQRVAFFKGWMKRLKVRAS